MSLIRHFVDAAPAGTAKTLEALACAESLTDHVALLIYQQVPVPGLSAEDFVYAFKYSGLTEPRNSEWNIIPSLREELVASKVLDVNSKQDVHQLLLSIARDDGNKKAAGSEIPSYLFTRAGMAYHHAGAGDLDAALAYYSAASRGGLTGAQWLGAKLAEEQERTKVIPSDAVETTFLRAWVMLREGRRREAMPLFRRVAATNRVMREVAISLHLIGNENSRGQRRNAERELRRSIEIGDKIGDQFGVAQTLHSLANLLSRQRDRLAEAEEVYRQSIEIGRALDNQFHVAQTLHSLANLLSRQRDRLAEAERIYRQSIEIDRTLDNQFGVAQTLHSLANLLSRQRDRLAEAEKAYKESLNLGEALLNRNHLAQVLRSYALAIEHRSSDEAIALLLRSLDINRLQGNSGFARLVERTIREVKGRAG